MRSRLLYVATGNRGKLREFRQILARKGIDAVSHPGYREPLEGSESYQANAALKARALAGQLRENGITAPVIADDSGIELDALEGGPGVLSARFGGVNASWQERRRLIIEAAHRAGKRSARFVCALHFIAADEEEQGVTASVSGVVPSLERGDGGFSYDAVFYYPPLGRTFAELSEDEKNAVSHRALAVEELLRRLGTNNAVFGM
jgi:XTP/dITP diphosphohydrolase